MFLRLLSTEVNLIVITACVFILSWILWVTLLWRISRFRVDRLGKQPPKMEVGLHVYGSDIYTAGGQKLLPWLRLAAIIAPLTFLVFMLCVAARYELV